MYWSTVYPNSSHGGCFEWGLKPRIYWPLSEIVQRNQTQCFDKWGGCMRAIIDCTEVLIQHPSLTKASTKTYSSYKNSKIWKFLIASGPNGLASYEFPPAGGRMSYPTIFNKGRLSEVSNIGFIMVHGHLLVVISAWQTEASTFNTP